MNLHSPAFSISRRHFLALSGITLYGSSSLPTALAGLPTERRITPCGPASRYTPTVSAAFVRRKGDYGMLWPGAIYDGEAARAQYTRELRKAETALGLKITLREEPIYSASEADTWLAEAGAAKPDGLLLLLLDRQQHAWPTASKAIDAGIPTVVFAPLGAAFTTNTAPPAEKAGGFLCSTNDFQQAVYGLKMLRAAAKLREMRFVVLRGDQRRDAEIRHFGTKLRYLPAREFLEEYERLPINDEVRAIAREYWRGARRIAGPTQEDVYHGVKSYLVARRFLEREEADGITMDCLGALGKSEVSLPCIAWSRMLDHGIPAACEADLGAVVTHSLVQLLFDRPGFQQDPVPETARQCLIGAHCTCPTRLQGFAHKPERYDLTHHHGKRDAVPRPLWPPGQRVTVADVILPRGEELTRDLPKESPHMVVSTGTVVDNLSVPPSGGCVVSVMVKLDRETDLLRYPGFHQLFFFGDFEKELLAYCRLFQIAPILA
jgi:hypothetical protein